MMTAEIKTQQKNVKKLLRNFNELTAVHFQNSGQSLTSYQCFEHLKRRRVCVCVRFFSCAYQGIRLKSEQCLVNQQHYFATAFHRTMMCCAYSMRRPFNENTSFFLTCNGAQILTWIFFFYEKPNAYPYSLKRIHPYQQ